MSSARYIEGRYSEDHATWHDEDADWKAAQIAQFLRDEAVVPKSICDLGCGTGGVLAELGRALPGVELVGYDISPHAVALAGEKHPGIDVRIGGVADVSERFDLVMLVDVFEHVEDYLGFLRSIFPLCNRLLCHIPLEMTAMMVARERPMLEARREFGHLHYFSKATALATLEDAGFDVVSSRYTPASVDFPSLTPRMKIAKWPRKIGFRFAPDLAVRILGGYSLLVLARTEA